MYVEVASSYFIIYVKRVIVVYVKIFFTQYSPENTRFNIKTLIFFGF